MRVAKYITKNEQIIMNKNIYTKRVETKIIKKMINQFK